MESQRKSPPTKALSEKSAKGGIEVLNSLSNLDAKSRPKEVNREEIPASLLQPHSAVSRYTPRSAGGSTKQTPLVARNMPPSPAPASPDPDPRQGRVCLGKVHSCGTRELLQKRAGPGDTASHSGSGGAGKRRGKPGRKNPGHLFSTLEQVLKAILLYEEKGLRGCSLSKEERFVFKLFIQKKRYYLLGEVDFGDPELFQRLSGMTTEKRTEERLKKIFKMSVKRLRSDFKNRPALVNESRLRLKRLKLSPEDGFFYHFFGEYCEDRGLDFKKLFKHRANLNVSRDYSKSSINKSFLEKIKDCCAFFEPLEAYLLLEQNELACIHRPNSILADSKERIKAKLARKIEEWVAIHGHAADFAEFKAQMEALFANKKYKLPWSVIDVACSLNMFKQFAGRE